MQSPEALLACFLNIYHILLCHALLVARKPSPDSKDKDSKVRQTRPIRVRIIDNKGTDNHNKGTDNRQ
jgi:hypothetical protein